MDILSMEDQPVYILYTTKLDVYIKEAEEKNNIVESSSKFKTRYL